MNNSSCMTLIKKSLFVFVMMILVFPAVQEDLKVIISKPLSGLFSVVARPEFTSQGWFRQEYQEQYRQHTEDFPGFKSDLVRLFNQVDYSLFSIAHASKVVIGKKGYPFGTEYIRSCQGKNFVGTRYCNEKVRLLKIIQDRLWNEKRIFLLVVFAPDKATFFPEYIPTRFRNTEAVNTNYSWYKNRCLEAGVNMIDFNGFFRSAKDTSRYPLYPKTGIHWSNYGAVKAADSLARYLTAKTPFRVPRMVVDKIEVRNKAGEDDTDIEMAMNLIWKIPHPDYAYPQYHFASDTAQKKSACLFIGDSFYWNWYYPGIIGNMFSNVDFWYYGKDIYPQTFTKPVNIGELNFMNEVGRQNIIVFLQTNGGYGNLGFDFIDRMYAETDPAHSRLLYYEKQIRGSQSWMEDMKKNAGEQHLLLDEQIREAALYMVNQELLDKKHQN